eukprot:gene24008-24376_t
MQSNQGKVRSEYGSGGYYDADLQGAEMHSGYAIPAEDGSGVIYAVPIDSEDPQKQQRGKQASFRFVSGESGTDGVSNRMYGGPASSTTAVQKPAYNMLQINGSVVETSTYNTLQSNGSVAETSMGTDGVSNRMYGTTAAAAPTARNATARRKAKTATNTADAGATLDAMSLRQKVAMYKRVAAGLAMLSFVLLIGLIVMSTAGNGSVGICADTTSATEALAGAETAASAVFAASAANATSAAPVAASLPQGLDGPDCSVSASVVTSLRDENERLRAALA